MPPSNEMTWAVTFCSFKSLHPSPATQDGPAHVICKKTASPANVARAINLLEMLNEQFRAPLFRAVPLGQIALTVLGTGQAPPLSRLDKTGFPGVIVLTDDDDTTRLGPDGWRYGARILRWARGAMLHGSGGQPEHYQMAVEGAQRCGRLVLVETCSTQIDAWTALALRTLAPGRILKIQPPAGGIHPVAVPRGQIH